MDRKPAIQTRNGVRYFARSEGEAVVLPAGDYLFAQLVDFANMSPEDKAVRRLFSLIENDANFYTDAEVAHRMVRDAFASFADETQVRGKTAVEINRHLRDVRAEEVYSLTDGRLSSWMRLEVSNLLGHCAYILALMIGVKRSGEHIWKSVRQCQLSECRKFFWSPPARGRRPQFCCERHRVRGIKRKQRGKPA